MTTAFDEPITDFCRQCGTAVLWIECPTGGWWKHEQHPADDHDARAPQPIGPFREY